MNIFVGKFGRSVSFDKSKWSTIGGDNEAPQLILALAKHRPDDTFYIVSATDFNKFESLKLQYPNVRTLMDGFNKDYDDHTYITTKCTKRNIKFDYGIMYNGITAMNNINGITYQNNKGEITKTKTLIFAHKYVGPIVHLINQTKVRWCLLTTDPRFYPMMARDIQVPPEIVLSQYNSMDGFKMRDYMTRVDTVPMIESKYAEIETCFLINKRRVDLKFYQQQRTDMINIVLNEGGGSSGGIYRGPLLKEYVLDNFAPETNINVYGKWDEKWMSDARFKGPVRIEELTKLLTNTKYTFIIPIQPDWATAKFCEMSYYGIIPFMHPIYDTQHNIKCPDFVRVSSPAELKEKIEFLEANDAERIRLITEIWNMYDSTYYTGEHLVDTIYKQINT